MPRTEGTAERPAPEPRWVAADAYLEGILSPADPVLGSALADSRAAGLPNIQVTPLQGRFLHLLARSVHARNILEVGTLGGYSAIWLARALPRDGRLVTLEIEPKHAEVARGNLARARLLDRVDVRVGPASRSLAALEAEHVGPFDLVFIDADKPGNVGYFDSALRLTRPGALVVVDNVVREGAIADAANREPNVVASRALIERMAAEPRVVATVIPTAGAKGFDGFAIALVTAG
jgi:predicted O-methyltransferase YrrM